MKMFLGLAVGFTLATTAFGAVIPVTSLADAGRGTLREAILKANQTHGADHIVLLCKGTIILKSPLPVITGKTSIKGPGWRKLAVSGGRQNQILTADSHKGVFITDVAFRDAYVRATNFMEFEVGGSAIRNYGKLEVRDCLVEECSTETGSVAIHNAGVMEIDSCLVQNCTANYSLNIQGVVANFNLLEVKRTTILNSGGVRAGAFQNSGSLILSRCLVRGCFPSYAQGDGGAIRNFGSAHLIDTVITDCNGYWGGGVLSSGFLAMTNTLISGCKADIGGAVFILGAAIIDKSTIATNRGYTLAGGIQNSGTNTWLLNSTISGNDAWLYGGNIANSGLFSGGSARLVINHGTIAGGAVYNDGQLSAANTIFAKADGPCVDGELVSTGFNLLQNAEKCTLRGDSSGNKVGVDPKLGPLADNGGPVPTHALLEGSPCIDAGSQAGIHKDQRGMPRPYNFRDVPDEDDGSDIGAFELRKSQVSHPGKKKGQRE